MSKKLIGRFYLKLTINGNLMGEFSNNIENKVFTESADFVDKEKSEDQFSGNYNSTWQENNEPIFAHLKIVLKNKGLYSLTWSDIGKSKKFIGEGMLVDDMILGDYREP